MNNFEYLKMVELRLRGLTINDSPNMEIIRLNIVRDDIIAKMNSVELQEYEESKNPKSEEQLKKEQIALIKKMNENRDRPSI